MWKNETFGKVEDQMSNLLHDMHLLNLKEENGLEDEEIQHSKFLHEEFRL